MTTHPESPDGVETAKRGKPSCDLRKRASTKRSSPVVLVGVIHYAISAATLSPRAPDFHRTPAAL